MSYYHKHRPQKFDDLVGQEHVKKTLANALKQKRVGHAYLFSGPRGVGKTTVARLLAKALNCENVNDFEPCNTCASCKEITQDKSLDVIEIDAASNRGIDEIRDLREKIKFAPSKSKYKVYIIDEVHMLTKEAFNALLKTLEEPPKHAVFIMATTELHKIPATILSRVQQFDFKRAGVENISKYLERITKKENINIEPMALRLISNFGEGSYRDATSILDQVTTLGAEQISLSQVQEILGLAEEKSVIEFLEAISESDSLSALKIINQIFLEGYDLVEFNKNIVEYLRRILICQTGSELFDKAELTAEQKTEVRNLSKKFERKRILEMINLFIEAGLNIKGTKLPQLPLELVVVEICGAHEEKPKTKNLEQKPESGINLSLKINSNEDKKSEEEKKHKESHTDSPKNDIISKDIGPRELDNAKKMVDSVSLKNNWPKVLSEISTHNRSLYFILKESQPVKIDGDKLVLGIKFKIYKERISDKKYYSLLNKTIEKVYGANYSLDFIIDDKISPVLYTPQENSKIDPIKPDNLVSDALEVFGET